MFRLDTPGGGGYGDPLEREPERVLADVREGLVSVEAAEREYGIILDATRAAIDRNATTERRQELKAQKS